LNDLAFEERQEIVFSARKPTEMLGVELDDVRPRLVRA
jgi:hypothetical protein